jgi:hypothetical protein
VNLKHRHKRGWDNEARKINKTHPAYVAAVNRIKDMATEITREPQKFKIADYAAAHTRYLGELHKWQCYVADSLNKGTIFDELPPLMPIKMVNKTKTGKSYLSQLFITY